MTRKGKVVSAKKFEGITLCMCQPYCSDKIDLERQKNIFTAYWQMDHKGKTCFLRESVRRVNVKQKKDYELQPIKRKNKREFSYQYTLKNIEGVSVHVCTDFFVKCLQENRNRIYRAVASATSNPDGVDQRGKSEHKHKIPETSKNVVRQFIKRLPMYESHYGRRTSDKMYLKPGLNKAKLYKIYEEYCLEEKEETVKKHCFDNIFDYEFNISFKARHSDTCASCDHYNRIVNDPKSSQSEKDAAGAESALHRDLAKTCTRECKDDIETAQQSENEIAVLTFDLQKALETPSLTTSVAYYKRQLWTYNLCIHDEVNDKGNTHNLNRCCDVITVREKDA